MVMAPELLEVARRFTLVVPEVWVKVTFSRPKVPAVVRLAPLTVRAPPVTFRELMEVVPFVSVRVPLPDLVTLAVVWVPRPLAKLTLLPLVLRYAVCPACSEIRAAASEVLPEAQRRVPPDIWTVAEPSRPEANSSVPLERVTMEPEPRPAEEPERVVVTVEIAWAIVPVKPERSPERVRLPPSVRVRVPVPVRRPLAIVEAPP